MLFCNVWGVYIPISEETRVVLVAFPISIDGFWMLAGFPIITKTIRCPDLHKYGEEAESSRGAISYEASPTVRKPTNATSTTHQFTNVPVSRRQIYPQVPSTGGSSRPEIKSRRLRCTPMGLLYYPFPQYRFLLFHTLYAV